MQRLPSVNDAPSIPHTPSSTINKMLQTRCGKKYENVVKRSIAFYICGFFHVITSFYNALNPDSKTHSHKLWMTACAVISSLIVLKAYLFYNIILASAFVMELILYYGALAFAIFGVGLGVSGAVFFDKDGGESAKKDSPKKPPVPTNPPPVKKFPEGATHVPQAVKKIEETETKPTAPAPAAPAPAAPAPAAPAPAAPSSTTHGTPAETSAEEKKTA